MIRRKNGPRSFARHVPRQPKPAARPQPVDYYDNLRAPEELGNTRDCVEEALYSVVNAFNVLRGLADPVQIREHRGRLYDVIEGIILRAQEISDHHRLVDILSEVDGILEVAYQPHQPHDQLCAELSLLCRLLKRRGISTKEIETKWKYAHWSAGRPVKFRELQLGD